MTNEEQYGPIPKLSEKVKEQRLWPAGHCHRHPELPSKVIVWEPPHGRGDPGQPAKMLLTTLIEEAEVESRDELATLLADREVWYGRHRAHLTFRSLSRQRMMMMMMTMMTVMMMMICCPVICHYQFTTIFLGRKGSD